MREAMAPHREASEARRQANEQKVLTMDGEASNVKKEPKKPASLSASNNSNSQLDNSAKRKTSKRKRQSRR